MLKRVLFSTSMFFSCFSYGGSAIDSLNKLLSPCPPDTHRTMLLNAIAEQYKSVGDYEHALASAREARTLSIKLGFKRGLSGAMSNFSTSYCEQGDFKKALAYIDSAIAINDKENDFFPLVRNYQSKGLVLEEMGNLSDGLEYELRALKMMEDLKVPSYMLEPSLVNIGNVQIKMGQYPKALDYYLQALKACGEDENKGDLGILYNNIAAIYTKQEDYDKAIYYTMRSLKIRLRKNDKKGISGSYNNLGNLYGLKKDYVLAIDYLNKALTIRKELGLKKGMASTYSGIAGVYSDLKQYASAEKMYVLSMQLYDSIGNKEGVIDDLVNLGSLHFLLKEHAKAISETEQALKLAREGKYEEYILSANMNLSECYRATGQWEKSLNYYHDYISVRDSMFNKEKTSSIVQSQMNYDFEKKQAALQAEQDKKDALAEKDRQKERLLLNIFIAGAGVFLFFALVILRSYRQKRKANLLLEEQKKEIAQQKELVDEKNKEIVDSIHYAQKIQSAILPADDEFEKQLPGSFILFKPKDIVSGDFYWISQKEGYTFYVAADCTGHGVPGGFMSMLGTALLNEVINEKKIFEPADILDMLRIKIILALKQKGLSGENKDGMDMCLVRLNESRTELVYAAANNSLYLVRDKKITDHKGDKQPVGISGTEIRQFSQHTITLQKGDHIYTFTDGYADQFGGPKGKKFKYKQLEEILAGNTHCEMKEQKALLEKIFLDWKMHYEQVDDVCVIGVKI